MSRSGSPSNFSNDSFHIFQAVNMSFDTGEVRLWSGYSDLTIDGKVFTGSADFLGISSISESGGVSANGVNVTISGLNSSYLNLAIAEKYQFRPLSCYIGSISEDGTVQSYLVFKGRMSSAVVSDNANKMTISISAESRLIDLERTRTSHYTDQQQKAISENDYFFDQVVNIQDREIVWQ